MKERVGAQEFTVCEEIPFINNANVLFILEDFVHSLPCSESCLDSLQPYLSGRRRKGLVLRSLQDEKKFLL